jgi:hypothetical protein
VNPRGRYQGRLISDLNNSAAADGGGRFVNLKDAWTLRVTERGDHLALALARGEGCYCWDAIVARSDPGSDNYGNQNNLAISGQNLGKPNPAGWMPNFIGGSIAEGITAGVGGVTEANVLLSVNSLSAHQANFDGSTFQPISWAEVIAKYKRKAGSTLGYLREAVDYEARTIDLSLEPPWIGFSPVFNVEPESTQTSGLRKLIGGGPGQPFTCNVRYRTADTLAGANLTAWQDAGSGTIDEGKFVELEVDASGDGSTLVQGDFAVRGYSNTFNVTTAAVTPFTAIDNQGARSTFSGNLTGTGGKRIIVAIESKFDATTGTPRVVGNGAGLNHSVSSGKLRWQFVGSSTVRVDGPNIDASWHRQLLNIQLDKTNAAEVVEWYIDDTLVSPTGTINTTGTTSFNIGTILNNLGLFAAADGASLMDGQFRFLLIDVGDATMTMPDISNPAVRNSFTKENLADGGVDILGRQAKGVWFGDPGASDGSEANTFNASGGLLNKGSVSGWTLTKQAGTYIAG